MSKRKSARKVTLKRPAKKKAAAPRTPRAPRSPRSQSLPGMAQVRSQKLDNICESIHDERQTMNAARTEEQSLLSAALQVMTANRIPVYVHGGIELVRVPGAEKLRVRVVKSDGDAGAGDLERGPVGEGGIAGVDEGAGGDGGASGKGEAGV